MTAYLFDIDGVLTDPVEKRVTEPELLTVLLSLLQKGDLVCFNTGRSIKWMTERVISPFFEKLEQKQFSSDVIAIAEKGGVWVTFDEQGRAKHTKDQAMVVPKELQDQIKQLANKKYKDSMFFDETKETMISIEMQDGFEMSVFHVRQKELVDEIKTILSQTELSEKYKVDPSTISTDIEEKHAGKALGVDRFLTLLNEKGGDPSQFVCFGDSHSDLEMADELHEKGKDVTFVYTGDKDALGEVTKPYPIKFVAGYAQGTLEFLKQLHK